MQERQKMKSTIKTEIKSSERNFFIVLAVLAASLLANLCAKAQTPDVWEGLKGDINLYLANDLGRNGYYEQKNIAELMGVMAETIGPECVLAAGDIHHFYGVASTEDPLWTTNYELIYSHPELMIPWYPILGNHEYRGNTQAVLDYASVSRRWMMPSRYYCKVFQDGEVTMRVVMIDTSPIIERYREDTYTYPDACKQDADAQMAWLDETLGQAKEDWIIVVGHHPIYADTPKDENERTDMQNKVLPILRKYGNVAIYACGHIHDFQHIKKEGDNIDYVVNSAGSLARKVNPIDGTIFCSSEPGFSIIVATKEKLCLHMIDKQGNVLHTVEKVK